MNRYITPTQVRAARAANSGGVPVEQILAAAEKRRQHAHATRRAIAAAFVQRDRLRSLHLIAGGYAS